MIDRASAGAADAATRWVDYAFAVRGAQVERDYPADLYAALRTLAPWLDDEPLAAVHPLRGLTPAGDAMIVGGRTRLLLRVPARRGEAVEHLQGCSLELAAPLTAGRHRCRRRRSLRRRR
jgi:hypothetical protein